MKMYGDKILERHGEEFCESVAKLAILISTFLSLVANWNVGVAMYPN
jgi:hypothetical protein